MGRARVPRAVLIVFVLLALMALASCKGPSFVDKECIKGRISTEQAEEVNAGPWGHLPSYNRDAEGKCVDCAEAEDRIFAARCSEFIKKLTLHD